LAGVQFPADVAIVRNGCGDWRTALQAEFANPARVRFAGSYGAACGERQWPVAYVDPASYAARAVAGMWRQLGGEVKGQVRDGRVPTGLLPTFEMSSPPLAEVIRDINKYSNNVMAQQVFLTIGLQRATPATFDSARAAVSDWWRDRIGGEAPAMRNGSGLARDERISAAQLARLLQAAWASPFMPEFVSSLPLGGIDGTLRRFAGRPGVHLKTGSLRDVQGVAGYVEGAGGKRWVLVAIANHPDAAAVQNAIDALIAWTAQGE
jgi:D-alanyl-D-alanine carboxypeptidase/D-alanyl-D-alanine-endopeptidase (penicillin-binding protein 4)